MAEKELTNRSLERLYLIKFRDLWGFVPGHNQQGEQIVLGVLSESSLVAFFFSPDGHYLRQAVRPIDKQPDPTLSISSHSQLATILDEATKEYIHELGMVEGDIRIHHFAAPEWRIGIAEWPDGYFDRLQECGGYPPDGDDPLDETIIEWKEQKCWVLYWQKDYWMLENGEVEST